MRLFRSEEHVAAWCRASGRPMGGLFTPDQLWELARRWFADRLALEWRRRTPAEVATIFADVGLRGPFWSLDGA